MFDSDTALVRDGQGGSVQQGNVATYYNSTVPLADGEKLSGSRATIESVDINTYGLMTATIDYIAPEWVAEGSLVTLDTDVLYYGAATGNTAAFTGVVGNNGRATLKFVSTTPFEYLPYTKSGISFGGITAPADEVFSLINVYYFDQDDNRIDQNGVLDMSYTDSTMPTSGTNELNIKLPSTATGSANIVGSGMDPLNTYWNYSDLNVGKESTGNFNADGNAPVVITINTSGNIPTYRVTNNVPAAGISVVAGTNLIVTYTDKTGIGYNSEESVSIKLSSFTPSATVAGYRVVNRELGIDTVLTDATATSIKFRVTSDISIDTGDFTITAVEPLAVQNYAWNAGMVQITFNRAIKDTITTSDINVSGVTCDIGVSGNVVTLTATSGNFTTAHNVSINSTAIAVDGTSMASTSLPLDMNHQTLQ